MKVYSFYFWQLKEYLKAVYYGENPSVILTCYSKTFFFWVLMGDTVG